MEFSRQEYCSGLPFPPPGHLPDLEIEPASPEPPALADGFFTTEPPGMPRLRWYVTSILPSPLQASQKLPQALLLSSLEGCHDFHLLGLWLCYVSHSSHLRRQPKQFSLMMTVNIFFFYNERDSVLERKQKLKASHRREDAFFVSHNGQKSQLWEKLGSNVK